MRDATAPPTTLIMRFHNYKDKMEVMAAARTRKGILYKDQQVRIYPDLAARTASAEKTIRLGLPGTPQFRNSARSDTPGQVIGD